MKILIIGSGGREHAFAAKIKASPLLSKLYVAPGNPGMASAAELVPIGVHEVEKLRDWALQQKIDLTVVGPEAPLVEGIVDAFQKAGLKIFGPTKRAAILEASKVYTKQFLKKYHIPTAEYETFTDVDLAFEFIRSKPVKPWVIKADGLAAGKGVIITQNYEEAFTAIRRIMIDREFGESGQEIIIEEFLVGEEVSFMAVCDGVIALPLATSQDHKRLSDNDQGPNTGGMGAYSPAPIVTSALHEEVMQKIIQPTLKGMEQEGRTFQGFLYAGLMIVKGKPYVLEFNVRMGDPETEVIFPRMESDLLALMLATLEGKLQQFDLHWKPESCVGVVLAAEGYPQSPKKGDVISGLDSKFLPVIKVFHAGTSFNNGQWQTAGGRVLVVTSLGKTFQEAINRTYQAISSIQFRGMQYRKDIAKRALPE